MSGLGGGVGEAGAAWLERSLPIDFKRGKVSSGGLRRAPDRSVAAIDGAASPKTLTGFDSDLVRDAMR